MLHRSGRAPSHRCPRKVAARAGQVRPGLRVFFGTNPCTFPRQSKTGIGNRRVMLDWQQIYPRLKLIVDSKPVNLWALNAQSLLEPSVRGVADAAMVRIR